MTWKEFNDYVKVLLTVDSDRLGDEALTPKLIKLGVLEVQGLINRYQVSHEDTYEPDDFTTSGAVSVGDSPADSAEIREATILRYNETDDITTEHPCVEFSWERRGELKSEQFCIKDNNGRIAISPNGSQFYVYPEIVESEEAVGSDGDTKTYSYELRLVWDGQKVEYEDEDETPFDELLAHCVSAYVKRELLKEIDPQLSATFNVDYLARRQSLFLRPKTRLKT